MRRPTASLTPAQAALEIRRQVLRMHRVGPNVGSALSCADILAVLFFDVMTIEDPADPGRDRLILSKGHAASALYAALALKGFVPEGLLDSYLQDGSPLCGHPVRKAVPGVEVSTGSLGHGLAIGVGLALAATLVGRRHRTFVVLGDGECQEGEVWEAAMIASRLGLDHLVAVVDANGLQGYDRTRDVMPEGSVAAMFRALGWGVSEVDGHDLDALSQVLRSVPAMAGRPTAVVARTVKGRGVREMEDRLEWHYFSVPEARLDAFLEDLERKP